MSRIERRREERERRKRGERKKETSPSFLRRNWKKIALGTAALGVAAAVITAGVLLSRDSKPPSIEPAKVESVLSIAKQRIGECYDNAYKFWQTGQGIVDCDVPLTRMFAEIGKAADIDFGPDTGEYIRKLQTYLASHGFFMDYIVQTINGQGIQSFYIAPVKGEEKKIVKLAEGKREVTVIYLGDKFLGDFIEERLGEAVAKTDLTREGRIYVQRGGLKEAAHNLWDFYETHDFENEITQRESLLRTYYESGDIRNFNGTFAEMLIIQEWKDVYDLAKQKGKGAGDFANTYVAANTDIVIHHGATHVYDSSTNSSERERKAKLQELLALPELSPEYMLQGYEILGNATGWMNLPSERHGLAGRDVMSCMTDYVDKSKQKLPQLNYADVIGEAKQRNLALILKLPQLTKDQIFDAAQACYTFFSKN